jgi:gliding motility-associated-like protein
MRKLLVAIFTLTFCALFGQQGFVQNDGQWDDPSNFVYRFGANSIFFTPDSIVFSILQEDSHGAEHSGHPHFYGSEITFESFALQTTTNQTFRWEGVEKIRDNQHYFVGPSDRWRIGVSSYGALIAKDVYPHIDLRVYPLGDGLKYDWIVHPGGDIDQIEVRYSGIEKLRVGRKKLVLHTTRSTFNEELPRAYQGDADIEVDYEQTGDHTAKIRAGFYDTTRTLVIDPVYIFSTYSGSTADNFGYTSTFDDLGNAFGGGIVFGAGYPVTLGAIDTSFSGGLFDAAISKFSSDGTQLLWSTHLGGSDLDQPHSLECDENGNLYILGITGSSDYSVVPSSYDTSYGGGTAQLFDYLTFANGTDIFVAALSANGDSLLGATYLGGASNEGCNDDLAFNYGDSFRGEIEVQRGGGDVFIVSSAVGSGYPVTADGKGYIGGQDGVISVLNRNLDSLITSTYVGTKGDDALYSIALAEKQGNSTHSSRIFLAGGVDTDSSFVFLGQDSLQVNTIGGHSGLLIAAHYDNGLQLLAADATYDSGYDQHYFVEVNHPSDTATQVTVMGQNKGGITASDTLLWGQAGSAQYFSQYNYNALTLGFDKGRTAVWGTGQTNEIDVSPTALLVDYCGNVYFSGWGGSPNYEGDTEDLWTSPNAPQSTTDGEDFYFVVLRKDWKDAEIATFWGGSGREHVDGGTSRFDSRGRIFQAVCAGCGGNSSYPAFPSNAYSTTNNSINCNLAVTVIDLDVQQASTSVSAPLEFCFPNGLSLTDSSENVDIWDVFWGDGQFSLNDTTLGGHYYPAPGTYDVVLIGQDTTCDTWDTTALSVDVLPPFDSVFVELDYDSCAYGMSGTNFLFAEVRSVQDSSLTSYDVTWQYTTSSGSSYFDTGTQFSNPLGQTGMNVLSVSVYDPTCGITQLFSFTVEFKRPPSAGILSDIPACTATDPAEFTPLYNTSSFAWFVNGDSLAGNGNLELTQTGNYEIILVAYDKACGTTDSAVIDVDLVGADTVLAVPNVITPNADGRNDTWRLSGSTDWDEFHIILFNRWGVKVFETRAPTFDWGADYDGKTLSPGVYFYQVQAKNICSDIQQEGTLHITY